MFKFGIIGCGHIASKHVKAIESIAEASLVAVCDPLEERLLPFKEKGILCYKDYKEMLNLDLDVVCICTPSYLHSTLALACAKAKKHVIVEKPLALNLQDAKELVKACRENNVKLSVVYPNRFRPAVLALREYLRKGYFGKLGHVSAAIRWNRNDEYYAKATWRKYTDMCGGILFEQAIHMIDLLLWLIGDVVEVSTYSATRFRKIETEDTSLSIFKFKNGALGVLEAAVTIYPESLEETLGVFGEKGTAVISGKTANWFTKLCFKDLSSEDVAAKIQRINEDPFGIDGHTWILKDMLQAIKNKTEPMISLEDGIASLKFIDACLRSSLENKPILL